MTGRTRRPLAALERAFLALDRGMGGANPPPALLAFAARHPAGCATAAAPLVAILAGNFSVFRTVLVGTCAWLLFWSILRLERRRQAHYARIGYDTGPRGSWSTARPRAVLTTMLVAWGPVTVFIWLVARPDDDPYGWRASAVFGALAVVGGYIGGRLKERRRTRARAAADEEAGLVLPAG
ncbi:hypothetical protein OH768_26880 [Streptomyces sp. NBC_01622]|uniref:hypothetical protein n=1 Tax=Streptomyces sp. NBC_01622 TaxID=2975903 RepID=UPI00386F79A8|nr:hypothetical protein OH768_26880 [Streptomyces sp. NBC_01622]